MEDEMKDVNTLKERVLDEVECLGFPLELFFKKLEDTSCKWSEIWISKFTEKLLEKYQSKPDLESNILNCKQEAIEIYQEVIKLRGENLRDCIDAYDIFHEEFAKSDDEEDSEDKKSKENGDEYTEEMDKDVDKHLKELYMKKSMCFALKRKLSELRTTNKRLSDLVEKTNQN